MCSGVEPCVATGATASVAPAVIQVDSASRAAAQLRNIGLTNPFPDLNQPLVHPRTTDAYETPPPPPASAPPTSSTTGKRAPSAICRDGADHQELDYGEGDSNSDAELGEIAGTPTKDERHRRPGPDTADNGDLQQMPHHYRLDQSADPPKLMRQEEASPGKQGRSVHVTKALKTAVVSAASRSSSVQPSADQQLSDFVSPGTNGSYRSPHAASRSSSASNHAAPRTSAGGSGGQAKSDGRTSSTSSSRTGHDASDSSSRKPHGSKKRRDSDRDRKGDSDRKSRDSSGDSHGGSRHT